MSEQPEGVYDCGHTAMTRGCGGCDPGAIDFVIDDEGRREAFDPAKHLTTPDAVAASADPCSDPAVVSFANHIVDDYDVALSHFFASVEKKMQARGLTIEQVHAALVSGYAPEIADSWDDWILEGER